MIAVFLAGVFGAAAAGVPPAEACLPRPYPDAVFFGTTPGGHFGAALAGGRDATGDALPEVLAGAPEAGDDGEGLVQLLCASGACDTLYSGLARSQFGAAVALVPDLTGDGLAEALIGAWDAANVGEVWLVPGGATRLGAPLVLAVPADGAGRRVGSGDFDGDGATDLVISGFADAWILRGLGGLSFGDPLPVQVAGADENLGEAITVVGDLDGDGADDLVVHDTTLLPDVAGWWLPSGGQLAPIPFVEPGVKPWNYRSAHGVGDVDGDGVPDVVLVGNDGFALFRGTTDGPVHVTSGTTDDDAPLTGVDWDGDGTNELAVAYPDGALVISAVDAAGIVEPPLAEFEMPCEARSLAASDWNGDGKEELFVGVPYADLEDAPQAGIVWVLSANPPAQPPDLGGQDPDDVPIPGEGIDRCGCSASPEACGYLAIGLLVGFRRARRPIRGR
jgi:FG-GAP-like repeat/FG-GAP repeat